MCIQKKTIYFPFVVLLTTGLGVAWVVRHTSRQQIWQRILINKYGPIKAKQYIKEISTRSELLLSQRPLPENAALRQHLTGNIIPGLAFYQLLLQQSQGNQEMALAETEAIIRAWTMERCKLLFAPLKLFPLPFSLFKWAFNQMMKSYPAVGWDINYLEHSDRRIAFNMTSCFYLNTLTAYGAPELTAVFCKSDDVMAEFFPENIRFVREHTLGRGDDLCDFQYCNMDPVKVSTFEAE
jgi:hypothetical protein